MKFILNATALGCLLLGGSVAHAAAVSAPTATSASVPSQQGSPGQLVQQNSQRVVRTLVERRRVFQSDPAALRAFVRTEFNSIFDRLYAARLVLGRNTAAASDVDVAAFADALADNLMTRYGNSLLEVDPGLAVKIVSETPLRGGAIVKVVSRVDRRNGAPLSIDYMFHRSAAGRWQAFDVIVEGVSFVQTLRSQFGEALQTRSLAQLTADLRANKVELSAPKSRR